MTDTTVNEPAKPSHVQIDPMAAASEAMALNEFYRQRALLLANQIATLTRQLEAAHAATVEAENAKEITDRELDGLRAEREVIFADLSAANQKAFDLSEENDRLRTMLPAVDDTEEGED
ncbi:hypothetical protein BRY73_02770 [Ochrobactrum sp. P6BS-III]|uniref:hypothetical protein n=1 Tax=unclassified Ochrobactrum TaxID=239106 RepID=UPI0009D48DFC|nr:hypothetical protein [Ochrobactrum sp. P6BSIII]OOL20101.1 hypothetical protein BRY73_02770 [Ochrobactrum sp. P6BS-III]